jgi:RNA polymerase sigma factor (TIGR02999 family)
MDGFHFFMRQPGENALSPAGLRSDPVGNEPEIDPDPLKNRDTDEVFSLVYEELRRLASAVRRNDRGMSLNSTALVHEAWFKLKDTPRLAETSIGHFKAIAAKAMRQVLVDAARKRFAEKRGGELVFVTLDDSAGRAASTDAELITLDTALERLAAMNARQAKVVECRFFGGLSVSEAASMLNVSESVVERDWRVARAWLAGALRPAAGS